VLATSQLGFRRWPTELQPFLTASKEFNAQNVIFGVSFVRSFSFFIQFLFHACLLERRKLVVVFNVFGNEMPSVSLVRYRQQK